MKRVLAAAMVAAGVLATAGCSGDRDGRDGSPASAASLPPPTVTATPSVSNLNDVKLPLDRYTTTIDQLIDLDYASKAVAADCMKRFGITWKFGERAELNALRDRTNRLGLIDEAVAKRAGYHDDPERAGDYTQTDRDRTTLSDDQAIVLLGATPGEKAPDGVPEGGCLGEGHRKIAWNLDEDAWLEDLTNEAAARTFADDRALKVAAAWSACMKTSGYRYAKPDDANNDARWWKDDKGAASRAEISTAVADVRCKRKVGYLDQMTSILSAYQQQIVEVNAERLETAHQHTQEALKNAAAVLSGR
ncbi:hypothetical protein FHR83_001690 [Actinoplanes campanulatus]|uniref:Lipoprotein n=1 Tax=Actinoplanes campanulatus TaxID=113559 RepID=A0A7W5ADA7_9ACTN|nr:hypothetical protein [Actinoplanes campanulatus]MBB3094041.1 hypothetical protein [Actinoplanes campanulatus]GGN33127.1 hypothetical protein GCM10010109_54860 [Actinoplanes campanulatus]GID38261.1 hypothetical protein Aca09nite_47670 [Actinoplanes campanulatus]